MVKRGQNYHRKKCHEYERHDEFLRPLVFVLSDNELVRNILLALLASLAKQEAKRMSERVKAGMARAKADGKRIGRPAISLKLKHQIAKRIAAGESAYAVAKDLGIDRHTAQKYA